MSEPFDVTKIVDRIQRAINDESPLSDYWLEQFEDLKSAIKSQDRSKTDQAIIERVDKWFGGSLCIGFKQSDIGLPNTPITYLYRSDVLAGLGVSEEASA